MSKRNNLSTRPTFLQMCSRALAAVVIVTAAFAVLAASSAAAEDVDSGSGQKWHNWFAPNDEIPAVGDVNGDGLDDIITFNKGDVWVALSTGSGFGEGQRWDRQFGRGVMAWLFGSYKRVPAVGDVNGDGLDDIVSFTTRGFSEIEVALSTGSGYAESGYWASFFAVTEGNIPMLADVNGDGLDDSLRFTSDGLGDVWVALSTGTGFENQQKWHNWFAPNNEIPAVGDVNDDGLDDIITFTSDGLGDVWVALTERRSPPPPPISIPRPRPSPDKPELTSSTKDLRVSTNQAGTAELSVDKAALVEICTRSLPAGATASLSATKLSAGGSTSLTVTVTRHQTPFREFDLDIGAAEPGKTPCSRSADHVKISIMPVRDTGEFKQVTGSDGRATCNGRIATVNDRGNVEVSGLFTVQTGDGVKVRRMAFSPACHLLWIETDSRYISNNIYNVDLSAKFVDRPAGQSIHGWSGLITQLPGKKPDIYTSPDETLVTYFTEPSSGGLTGVTLDITTGRRQVRQFSNGFTSSKLTLSHDTKGDCVTLTAAPRPPITKMFGCKGR